MSKNSECNDINNKSVSDNNISGHIPIQEFNIIDNRIPSNGHNYFSLNDNNKYYITDTWRGIFDMR